MTDYIHLTVPQELGEEIRDCDGRNDAERLFNWAGREVQQSIKQDLKIYLDELVERLEIDQRTGEIELR